MMRKIYIAVALAALMPVAMQAQEAKKTASADKKKELTKEITLEKDFVPVERKVEKKNTLPQVQKALTKEQVALKYSDWAVPAPVPTTVPTMMPYGYRTAHNFSDRRGYLDLGAGSQVSFVASAGYRIVDNITTKLGVWFQHNSSWNGKNSSPLISDELRMKQKFCNNVLGVNFANQFTGGTLRIDATGQLDLFNYYGGVAGLSSSFTVDNNLLKQWEGHKQKYHNGTIGVTWDGETTARDRDLSYSLGVSFSHVGFSNCELNAVSADKSKLSTVGASATQKLLAVKLGTKYVLSDDANVGLDASYSLMKKDNGYADATPLIIGGLERKTHELRLVPFYEINTSSASVHLGAKLMACFGDGSKLRFAPDVRANLNLAPGFALTADVTGDLKHNTLSELYSMSRYSSLLVNRAYFAPLSGDRELFTLCDYSPTYTPVDAEVGFKVGSFGGFALKVFAGYRLTEGALWAGVTPYTMNESTEYHSEGGPTARYAAIDAKGFKVGAELNYKYRSLVDFNAKVVFAPQKSDFAYNGDYKACLLDVDAPKYMANLDLKVNPIRRLSVNVGFDVKGGRRYITPADFNDKRLNYTFHPMNNVLNLRAGASYRVLENLTVWAQASNLLNRRWDVLPYIGAQRLNVMGGVALVF